MPTTPKWSKSYLYLGGRLLSTLTPNGSGGEAIEYHHPDRLGTRLVSNAQNGSYYEQVALPFGTALNAESSGATNQRFTSYDRSATTKLDYAVNRHYDPQQGRFTQTDPIGMGAANLGDPQSLNSYSYTQNDPVNFVDPSGLLPCEPGNYSAECGFSGFGGWGGGVDMNARVSPTGSSGLQIIREAESRTVRFGINRWEDILFTIVEPSMFDMADSFLG